MVRAMFAGGLRVMMPSLPQRPEFYLNICCAERVQKIPSPHAEACFLSSVAGSERHNTRRRPVCASTGLAQEAGVAMRIRSTEMSGEASSDAIRMWRHIRRWRARCEMV